MIGRYSKWVSLFVSVIMTVEIGVLLVQLQQIQHFGQLKDFCYTLLFEGAGKQIIRKRCLIHLFFHIKLQVKSLNKI